MTRQGRGSVAILLVSTAIVVAFPGTGTAVDEVEARWRREYPQAAETLEQSASRFRATGMVRNRWLDGMIFQVEKLVVGRSGDRAVYTYDGITQQDRSSRKVHKPGLVACVTPDSKFYLRKSSEDSPYILERYGRELGNDVLVRDAIALFTRSATEFVGRTLLQRMRSPAFRVLAAEEVDPSDGSSGRWARIRYQIEDESMNEEGSVWLEPTRSWAIRLVELEITSKEGEHERFRHKIVVNYPDTEAIRLIPNDAENRFQTANPEVYQQFHVTLTSIEAGPPPDSMFRLSGYGLPDVPLRPVPARRAFSWRSPLFWGSLAVAAVAVLALRWLRRSDSWGAVTSQ